MGARSLQGQGQQRHALPRHRHRHRRLAGAVPDHPVRGEGLDHVSRRRRARLGGAGLYRHRLRLLGQGVRALARFRTNLARLGRGDPGGDAGRLPVRLSQPQPLARALRPYHARLVGLSWRARCAGLVRAADRLGDRARLALRRRGARLRPRRLSVVLRLRPRRPADPDLAPARGVGDRSGARRDGCHHQRHRRPGAPRRARADRDADRVHGDAARLRRGRDHRHRFRRRAPRACADRRRRHDLGLGRLRRQGLHQPRDRGAARPQARLARRPGGTLARRAASARSRPLPRRARQRAGATSRPAQPGLSAAHPRRPLPLVRAQGAAGSRLGRGGGAARRHAHRRHRVQERGGTAPARRSARQSDRAAQS